MTGTEEAVALIARARDRLDAIEKKLPELAADAEARFFLLLLVDVADDTLAYARTLEAAQQ
jgi:hypothetical protein